MLRTIALFVFATLFSTVVLAQQQLAADFMKSARIVAFEHKNYAAARQLCDRVLAFDRENMEAGLFKAHLYAWDKLFDSARVLADRMIDLYPAKEEAWLTRIDIAYWSENYIESGNYCQTAIQRFPGSTEVHLRKARANIAAGSLLAARKTIDSLLIKMPDNEEIQKMNAAIKKDMQRNRIGISYEYTNFNEQFRTPWHLTGIEYSRFTRLGVITGRLQYARRFGNNGYQYEIESYPKINSRFYSYVSFSIASGNHVFPAVRSGVSVFANLPHGWEMEAGARYLKFDNDVWVYTGSIGKYLGKYWLNAKTFLGPTRDALSRSFFLTARYYYSGNDNYFMFSVGTGVSADDARNLAPGANKYSNASRINGAVQHQFGSYLFKFNLGLAKNEYLPKV